MTTPDTPAVLLVFPQTSEARLRVALRQLDTALEEQRQAVATLRRELASLSGAVGDLGDAALQLQTCLSDAAEEARRAQGAAQALAMTATRMDYTL